MKKNKKILFLIGLLFLLFIIIFGVYLLVFKEDSKNNADNNKTTENSDDSRVISKSIDFTIDEMGYLIITTDITLSDNLKNDEIIEININAYDDENNLLHNYIASSKYFDIKDISEIHLGFDDNESQDVTSISYLESTVEIKERTIQPTDSYDFVVVNNPNVVEFRSLYRVFIDLDDYYLNNSGLATIEYNNGHKITQRISYLDDTDYIGVSMNEDFSTRDGSNLKRVCVYIIGDMWKI